MIFIISFLEVINLILSYLSYLILSNSQYQVLCSLYTFLNEIRPDIPKSFDVIQGTPLYTGNVK